MLPHTGPHGKDWYSGVLKLRETFLAPLEEMLPGEKQAKQNPNTRVTITNQARAGSACQQNPEEPQGSSAAWAPYTWEEEVESSSLLSLPWSCSRRWR